MLPYKVWLDRHDVDEDADAASACKAGFAAFHDAERWARELAASWLDRTEPVVVRVTGPGGNLRFLPLRTTIENY